MWRVERWVAVVTCADGMWGARLVGDMFACWLETESIEQVVV